MTKVINHTKNVNRYDNEEVRNLSKWIRSGGKVEYRDNNVTGLTTNNNSTLVPSQILQSAMDLTKNMFSFQPYLNYIPVKSAKGDYPLLNTDSTMQNKDELAHYPSVNSDISTIPFKISTYAGRIVLSRELMSDADFPITPLVSKQLSVLMTNTVNKLTSDKLKSLPSTNISNLSDLITAINSVDPRWQSDVFIGQSAWSKLLTLTDKNNDFYLLNNNKTIMGLKVIVLPNYLGLSNDVFVGDLSVAMAMFSRMATILQFSNNNIFGQSLAAIERMDIEITKSDAVKHLTFSDGGSSK